MVCIVGAALAWVSLALKPKQNENIRIDKMQQMLNSVNIASDKTNAIELYDSHITDSYVINDKGEFIGGAVAPGIRGSLESLVSGTAKLPRVEIETPKSVIGKNTTTNMQAGIVFGFAGLVGYIVKKIRREMKDPAMRVVATGGFSEIIASEISCIDHVDKLLTLQGLKYLYDINTSEDKK